MLLVLFQIGTETYGLDTENIEEIIPVIDLKPLPRTPKSVRGVFDYRGVIVPVVDISDLTLGSPSNIRLSTRIALLRYPSTEDNKHLLGIMAEKMTDVLEISDADFQENTLHLLDAPELGPVIKHEDGFIQCIDIARILPKELQESLFTENIVDQ